MILGFFGGELALSTGQVFENGLMYISIPAIIGRTAVCRGFIGIASGEMVQHGMHM